MPSSGEFECLNYHNDEHKCVNILNFRISVIFIHFGQVHSLTFVGVNFQSRSNVKVYRFQ